MSNWFILTIYSLFVYGVSNQIIYSHGPFHIYDKIHEIAKSIHPQLEELLLCFICLPSWIGIILSGLNLYFIPDTPLTPCMMIMHNIVPWWVIVICDCFVASAIGWLINTIQDALERTNSNTGNSDE